MTDRDLEKAKELQMKIKRFTACKDNNFQIKIENWTDGNIEDKDLRPETQAKMKQLLIGELEFLEKEFEEM